MAQWGARIFPTWRRRNSAAIERCDELSKLEGGDSWQLDPDVFHALNEDADFGCADWPGGFTMDLMADERNTQLPRFASRYHCRAATATNAFSVDWSQEVGFVNPPWVIIPQVIAHARACECAVTLVVPRRTAAAWWPMVAAPLEHPAMLPPGVEAVRDFDTSPHLHRVNGRLMDQPPREGIRAVRLAFRRWRARQSGADVDARQLDLLMQHASSRARSGK